MGSEGTPTRDVGEEGGEGTGVWGSSPGIGGGDWVLMGGGVVGGVVMASGPGAAMVFASGGRR